MLNSLRIFFSTFCLDAGQTPGGCLSRVVRGMKFFEVNGLFLLFLDKGKQTVLV